MNSFGHLFASIAKSAIRIVACICSMAYGAVWPIAVGFLAAEAFGIAEELVDKR